MIEFDADDKITLFQALYSWLTEEHRLMRNVHHSSSLSKMEKKDLEEKCLLNISKIEKMIDKCNEL